MNLDRKSGLLGWSGCRATLDLTVAVGREIPARKRGFSLVELAIAFAITAFCLLTLLALVPTGLHSADTATRETMAMNVGNGILADLKTAVAYAANANAATISSSRYQIVVPTSAGGEQYALYLDENGNSVAAASARYLAIVTLISPSAPTTPSGAVGLPKPSVIAHIFISWPAAANPSLSTTVAAYTPGNATDLRAQVKNTSGQVELVGALDLEQ